MASYPATQQRVYALADESFRRRLARTTRSLRSGNFREVLVHDLARLTWPARRIFGASPPDQSPAYLTTPQRLAALEARLDRLQKAWDRHLPALLDSVSVAVDQGRAAENAHQRTDILREDLDGLTTRMEVNLSELKAVVLDASSVKSVRAEP